jgi:hypothetical protein
MLRRASQSGLASAITSIAFDSTAPTVATAAAVTLIITTVDNHNLYPGARVSITGIASSNSDAAYNVTGQWLYKIINPKSFSITPTLTYAAQPTFTLTNATLWAPNAALNAYNILYGQPVVVPRPTFYNYAYPSLTATPSGTGVLLTWSGAGIANPAVDVVTVERLSGSSVVATISSGILATNVANTYFETGLATIASGNSYTYKVTVHNTLQSNIITQNITTLYYSNITSVTSSIPATTPTYIQVSWAAATGNTSVGNYEVDRSTTSSFTVGPNTTTLSTAISGSSTSYTDTTAAIGTSYYYRVRARKDFTYSSTSYPMYSNYATTASAIQVTAVNTTLNVNAISNTAYGTGAVVSGTISPNPAGGTVTITESGVTVGTATVNSSGAYTTTLSTTTSVATHNLSLSYGGTGIYQPSTNTASFTVSKANTSITGTPNATTTYPYAPAISGSILPAPNPAANLSFTFTLSGTTVPIISASTNSDGTYSFQVPTSNAGTYSGTVAFPGNANYNASSSSVSYTISKSATTVTGAVSTTVINIGSSITLTANLKNAYGSNVSGETVGWQASTDGVSYSNIATTTTDASGNATYVWTPGTSSWNYVNAYYNGSTNYSATSDPNVNSINIRAKYTVTTAVSGVANSYQYYAQTPTNGQIASTWTAPTISGAVNLTVTGVALSIAGRTGKVAPSVAAGLWTGASSGTLLANSNNVTLALKADGGATLTSFDFTSDRAVTQGTTYYVGFWRNQGTNNAFTQYDLDTTSGLTTKYDSSSTGSITTFTSSSASSGQTLLYTVTYYYYK